MGILAGIVLIALAVGVVARTYGVGAFRTRGAADVAPPVGPDPTPLSPVEPAQPSLRPWVVRGFEPWVAARWIEHGFDADHAYLLVTAGIELLTATRLREAGLDDDALVALVEETAFTHTTGADDLIALAERSPHLAPEFVEWIRTGLDADRALRYAEAGLTPSAAPLWIDAGWELDEAVPWCRARFEPATARAWQDHGFEAEEARVWKDEHFGIRQASEWRKLGDTPAKAREVEQRFVKARVTMTDGLTWLERGFSVEEICLHLPMEKAGN